MWTKLKASYSPKHKLPEVKESVLQGLLPLKRPFPDAQGQQDQQRSLRGYKCGLRSKLLCGRPHIFAQMPPAVRSWAPRACYSFCRVERGRWPWAAGAECNMPGCAPWPHSSTTTPLQRVITRDLPGPCCHFHVPICTSPAADTSSNQSHKPTAFAAGNSPDAIIKTRM